MLLEGVGQAAGGLQQLPVGQTWLDVSEVSLAESVLILPSAVQGEKPKLGLPSTVGN